MLPQPEALSPLEQAAVANRVGVMEILLFEGEGEDRRCAAYAQQAQRLGRHPVDGINGEAEIASSSTATPLHVALGAWDAAQPSTDPRDRFVPNSEVVRGLLERGADPNWAATGSGRRAIHTLVESGVGHFWRLAAAAADGGEGELAEWAVGHATAALEALAEHGADFDAIAEDTGETALMMAQRRGETGLAIALLELGASAGAPAGACVGCAGGPATRRKSRMQELTVAAAAQVRDLHSERRAMKKRQKKQQRKDRGQQRNRETSSAKKRAAADVGGGGGNGDDGAEDDTAAPPPKQQREQQQLQQQQREQQGRRSKVARNSSSSRIRNRDS